MTRLVRLSLDAFRIQALFLTAGRSSDLAGDRSYIFGDLDRRTAGKKTGI